MSDPIMETVYDKGTEPSSNDDSNNKNEQISDDTSNRTPRIQFLTGMKQDLAARVPLYWDDWKCPRSPMKVLNATWFVFVVQLIPALIFAELLDRQTEGRLAVAEVILSAGDLCVTGGSTIGAAWNHRTRGHFAGEIVSVGGRL